jgi:hypothetical protein
MRAAPSFELELQVGPRERALVSLWCGICLAAFSAWLVAHGWTMTRQEPMPSWVPALAASATGAVAGMAAWIIGRGEPATLGWSRGAWLLTGGRSGAQATPGSVALMLDLGPWMLLRFRPADRRACHWFGVDESAAGTQWHALRAALYRPVQNGTVSKGPAGDSAP